MAISLLKIDFFVKWLQWNIIREGKIKKCITRRVKMRMFAIAVCSWFEGAGKAGADEVDQSSSQWPHFNCQLHECALGEDLIDGHGETKMASLYGRCGSGLYDQGDRKHHSFGRGGAQSSSDNILMSRRSMLISSTGPCQKGGLINPGLLWQYIQDISFIHQQKEIVNNFTHEAGLSEQPCGSQ